MTLANTVAIVTGAGGGGSGRAVALRLAREGASVVVSDIDEAGGHETAHRIAAEGGRAVFFRADAGIEDDLRRLIACAEESFGGLDILVNNAGPYWPEPLGHWAETVQANLLGPMYATLNEIRSRTAAGPRPAIEGSVEV